MHPQFGSLRNFEINQDIPGVTSDHVFFSTLCLFRPSVVSLSPWLNGEDINTAEQIRSALSLHSMTLAAMNIQVHYGQFLECMCVVYLVFSKMA